MHKPRSTSFKAPWVIVATVSLLLWSCGGESGGEQTLAIAGGSGWTFADDTGEVSDAAGGTGGTCEAKCTSPLDCLLPPGLTPPCATMGCEAGCCAVKVASPETTCDDGDPCTGEDLCQSGGACAGTAIDCDDGKDCTKDSCVDGQCAYAAVDPDVCVIGGLCYKAGDTAADSPCQACDPNQSQSDWSFASGCCKSDSDCPAQSPCEQPVCDLASGKCQPNLKPGCCVKDDDCNDGDGCTVDTCDVDTKSCAFAPKDCTEGLPCVTGMCLNGGCQVTVKAGSCVIDGACVADGATKVGDSCQVCASATQPKAWTAKIGVACDDGNACTSDDTCSSAGVCEGTPVSGCCKTHQDCANLNDACTTATCDFQTGKCLTSTQPNCCTQGVCCDLATNITKAKGTQCSQQASGTQYQCNGLAVEQRPVYPGCDGLTPDKCSQAPDVVSVGPWTVVKTCTGTDVCNEKGSGIMPTCGPKEPTGTCVNACGGPAADGTCACGPSCVTLGTCCKDYQATCACTQGECCDLAQKFLKPKGTQCATKTEYQCSGQSIQKRNLAATCTGTSATCAGGAWSAWSTAQTCGTGTTCTVAADKSSASCKQTNTGGSCVGKCGAQSGSCWCDSQCTQFGDCCSDYAAACGGSNGCGSAGTATCKGKCGGQGTGCWCDAACVNFGDCCKDKTACCG